MISRLFKPLNIVCILCYIMFMGFAFNSKIVDALVLYVSEKNGKPIYVTKKKEYAAVTGYEKGSKPLVAVRYKTDSYAKVEHEDDNASMMSSLEDNDGKELDDSEEDKVEVPQRADEDNTTPESVSKSASAVVASLPDEELKLESSVVKAVNTAKSVESKINSKKTGTVDDIKEVQISKKTSDKDDSVPASIKTYIDAIAKKPWEYAELLDRYIVQYDKDTYIVLTIRPSLQNMMEGILKKYDTRISAGIIQDPATGEILALSSSHKNKVLSIEDPKFKTDNWAFKATFPVASIFKIITSAAGIDTGVITSNSNFLAYKKTYMKVWKAFASSHNGVFGQVAKKAGRNTVKKYGEAFGFNKNFFFDLPVGKSVFELPTQNEKMGQAAAGLHNDFLVSPMHVASIVSTVLNRGKTLKPYLVDYVVRKSKVVFKRRPFQLAQPIKESTAREIYKMMYATTAVGTGRKGFGGYKKCPDLAKICGGKTGTLTGASPNYLFTWFGGFTKATGRDLCIVTLSGQKNHAGTKAASIAGQVAYELYMRTHDDDAPAATTKTAKK